MDNEIRFNAPWSPTLKVLTFIVCVFLLGISAAGFWYFPQRTSQVVSATLAITPLAILLAALPFGIFGYVVTDSDLLVRRLGWSNRFKLAAISSASIDPEAMRGSIRIWGSAGLFGFFGWFRNSKLGTYRAYCTDLKRCVVLNVGGRNIVVSPDDPGKFTQTLNSRRL